MAAKIRTSLWLDRELLHLAREYLGAATDSEAIELALKRVTLDPDVPPPASSREEHAVDLMLEAAHAEFVRQGNDLDAFDELPPG